MSWTVVVYYPGRGKYQGGDYLRSNTFTDEKKARDHYTDMLMMYPLYKVELLKSEK